MAVIVADADKREPEINVAREGPGGVARQDVNFARRQSREAVLAGQVDIFDLVGVAKDGRRQGSAIGDIEADPVTLVVGKGEARQAGVDTAVHLAG